MPTTGPRYSHEEFRRRGNKIYERNIKPLIKPEDKGKFVAIDIESGEYEIDDDSKVATDRLWKRLRDPQPWLVRIGYAAPIRFGYGATVHLGRSRRR